MNDVSKLYQLVLNTELATIKNQMLDCQRINKKLLAFLQNVSEIGALTHVYTFWEQDHQINHQEVLDSYVEGMTMILSIGYEMRMDEIKSYEELPQDIPLEDLLLKIYEDVIMFKNTFNPIIYQNILDDYFNLGFKCHLSIEEIIESYE